MRLLELRHVASFLLFIAVDAFVNPSAHIPGATYNSETKVAVTRRSVLATAAVGVVPLKMSQAEANNVRWGIIGAGDVCEKKSGPGFLAAKNSKLTAVMSRTPGRAKGFAERNGIPKSFEDVDALLSDEEIDAVYVATPPGTHLELALKVCAAKKPCLLEKPMARNYAESKQIADAFKAAGVPLFVAYSSRTFARTAKVKQLLDSKAIGDLTAVTYRFTSSPGVRGLEEGAELPWRLKAEQSGGGLIMDVGCHILDRLDMLCGPLREVQGSASNVASKGVHRVEDSVVMSARLGGTGALFSGLWAFKGAEPQDELQFIGTAGTMTMAGGGPAGPVTIRRQSEEAGGSSFSEEVLEFEQPVSNYLELVEVASAQLLASSVAEAETETEEAQPGPPRLSVASAVRTAAVLDKVLEGYYGGRSDAFWLREESWPGLR